MNYDQGQSSEQPQENPTHDRNQLTDRLDVIERKLDLILIKLDGSVIKNCDKMGNHIDFVNNVYATVKVPLNYITNKIHKIINPLGVHKEMPMISDGSNVNDVNN